MATKNRSIGNRHDIFLNRIQSRINFNIDMFFKSKEIHKGMDIMKTNGFPSLDILQKTKISSISYNIP